MTTAFGTTVNQRNVHRSLATACITFQVERGYPVHQIADWAGTSERMIIDVYRHKLTDVIDLGPSDSTR